MNWLDKPGNPGHLKNTNVTTMKSELFKQLIAQGLSAAIKLMDKANNLDYNYYLIESKDLEDLYKVHHPKGVKIGTYIDTVFNSTKVKVAGIFTLSTLALLDPDECDFLPTKNTTHVKKGDEGDGHKNTFLNQKASLNQGTVHVDGVPSMIPSPSPGAFVYPLESETAYAQEGFARYYDDKTEAFNTEMLMSFSLGTTSLSAYAADESLIAKKQAYRKQLAKAIKNIPGRKSDRMMINLVGTFSYYGLSVEGATQKLIVHISSAVLTAQEIISSGGSHVSPHTYKELYPGAKISVPFASSISIKEAELEEKVETMAETGEKVLEKVTKLASEAEVKVSNSDEPKTPPTTVVGRRGSTEKPVTGTESKTPQTTAVGRRGKGSDKGSTETTKPVTGTESNTSEVEPEIPTAEATDSDITNLDNRLPGFRPNRNISKFRANRKKAEGSSELFGSDPDPSVRPKETGDEASE